MLWSVSRLIDEVGEPTADGEDDADGDEYIEDVVEEVNF